MNIRHWKIPGGVRSATQQDADSIQGDLSGTLPGLVAQSDAVPGSVSAAFAVYRNVDALYDVLLRLSQTASLAAPRSEAEGLQSALNRLEEARKSMGDAIFASAKDHDAELTRLQAAITAAAEQRKPVPVTVVNDGPAPTHHARRRRKRKTTEPAPSTGQTNTPPRP